jgi:hypothetical protein
MSSVFDLMAWMRQQCDDYTFDARGVFQRTGLDAEWPLMATDEDHLEWILADRGHLLPLPKEPAALANVLEVSIVSFLSERLAGVAGATFTKGTERGYPDLEIGGDVFGGGFHAVDVKAARRAETKGRPRTQSRITLYTGNTYFKWPDLKWPGTMRAFSDYATHLDLLLIYTLRPETTAQVADLEVIVQEPWRIASRQRSSTTREYIGAVDGLDDLRAGRGEFSTAAEFYAYWRKFNFRISAQVQRQFERLVRQQADELNLLKKIQSPDGHPSV